VNQDMSTDSSPIPAESPDPGAAEIATSAEASPDVAAAVDEAAALDAQTGPAVEAALSSADVDAPAAEPAMVEAAAEVPAVEAAPDVPAVEAAPDVPAVEAAPEIPAVEAAPDVPAVEAAPEVPAVEAAPDVPAVDAAPEVPAVEAAPEIPAVEAAPESAVETDLEQPAADDAPEQVAFGAASDVPGDESITPVTDPAATRPGPRPSPAALAGLTRPAPPRPVATSTATAAAPAAVAAPEVDPDAPPRPTDSETFGRIDDDGTVHVRTADGAEHPVGQWAAGTPEEGLAFFVRKYDDLSVEVDLATRRVAEGKAAPEQAAAVVKRARESLASPSMVGDLASLTERLDALDALVTEKRTVAAEARAAAKAAALAAREAIVAEAEALAESTQWKSTGERFKTLLDDWKAAPRADRTGEQALWKRFSHARSQFDKHRRQYFARLDSERGEAKQVKESLVAEAESLQGSTDWGATAGAYRDLMSRWKASGRAGKSDEDELWTRFRAAQDGFFAARNAALGQRDAGFAENLAAKEALLVEAEAIDPSDLKGAKSSLRSIQERWEKLGHVPRGDKERVEARLRKVEDSVRSGEQDQWRRSNPETKARASATVEQFSGSLEKLEKQHAAALTAGDARKATDLENRIATTKALLDAAEKAAAEFS
jgi:hypothetical protein